MSWFRLILLVLIALPATPSRAQRTPYPEEPRNFLFVVDVSSSMKRLAPASRAAVATLIGNGAQGHMRRGDFYSIWLFQDAVATGVLPPQRWLPEISGALASTASKLIENTKYSGRANLDAAVSEMVYAAGQLPNLTVFLLTDGSEVLYGTPYDLEISTLFVQHTKEQIAQKRPFVVTLAAKGGKFTGWAVDSAGSTINIPALPESPKPPPAPETSAPPSPKAIPPEVKAAVPIKVEPPKPAPMAEQASAPPSAAAPRPSPKPKEVPVQAPAQVTAPKSTSVTPQIAPVKPPSVPPPPVAQPIPIVKEAPVVVTPPAPTPPPPVKAPAPVAVAPVAPAPAPATLAPQLPATTKSAAPLPTADTTAMVDAEPPPASSKPAPSIAPPEAASRTDTPRRDDPAALPQPVSPEVRPQVALVPPPDPVTGGVRFMVVGGGLLLIALALFVTLLRRQQSNTGPSLISQSFDREQRSRHNDPQSQTKRK